MQEQKQVILTQQIDNLSNANKISKNRFKIISEIVKNTLMQREDVLNLLYKAKHTKSETNRAEIRNELYEKIKPHFDQLKKVGVIITLFSFPDNKTFLRVHKPSKFNDDLSKVRYSFAYVNEKKKSIRGFEQGKITHAFRNVYPLFLKDEYLGSVDIAFSSDVLQKHMRNLHNTDTRFILNKDFFQSNIWKMKDLSNYVQSIEHPNFLYSLDGVKKEEAFSNIEVSLNKAKKKEIHENISHNDSFAIEYESKIISFLPIKNIKDNKTVAYLVSYSHSNYLKNLHEKYLWTNIFSFILLLLMSFIIYNSAKKRIILNMGLEKEIHDQNKAFEIIFEKASDGVLIYENNKITQCNESVLNMFGFKDKNDILNKYTSDLSPKYQPDSSLSIQKAKDMSIVCMRNGSHNFEWKFKSSNDKEFWVSVTLTNITLKDKTILHALLRNISSQKEIEKELIAERTVLNYKAFHDTLTMLPNRELFNDRLSQSIKSADRNNESFALMFIDLDKFKHINDSLGHLIGDKVLQEVATRLKSKIRQEDTLARLGGDEFTILMQKINSEENVYILANNLIEVLRVPMHIEHHILNMSASIGISLYPQHAKDFEELVYNADIAMYKAKESGRNGFKIYTKDMK